MDGGRRIPIFEKDSPVGIRFGSKFVEDAILRQIQKGRPPARAADFEPELKGNQRHTNLVRPNSASIAALERRGIRDAGVVKGIHPAADVDGGTNAGQSGVVMVDA